VGKLFQTLAAVAALLFVGGVSSDAYAKDKVGKGGGAKVQVDKSKAKKIPPGQIKRYTRGAKLPTDLKWNDIGDLSGWKLKPPGKGNRYIRVGDDILEVSDDLTTVIDAVGIVGDLQK